jgi:hypothetical protein
LTEINFDLDSFLSWALSLAFAKQRLLINLTPRFQTNIQTNLKLFIIIPYLTEKGKERPRKVKIYYVPYYYLRRVIKYEDVSVFVFFLRIYDPEKATNFLGKHNDKIYGQLRI